MSDITDALTQQEIADSILDAPIVGVLRGPAPYTENNAEDDTDGVQDSVYRDPMNYFQEEIEDQETGVRAVLKYGDSEVEDRLAKRSDQGETGADQAVQSQPAVERQGQAEQVAQPETIDPSPQQVAEVVQSLDARLQECGYSEPEETLKFEMELADLFGTTLRSENLGLMDKTIGRAALSAGEFIASGRFPADGDISKIPSVSPAVAEQVSREVGSWFGRDPQTSPVHDKQFLANAVYRGMANLVNTVARTGKTDPREINAPEMCVSWCEAIHFGVTGKQRQFTAEEACPLVNSITTRVLGLDGKLQQAQARQGEGSRSNTGRGRGPRGPKWIQEGLRGSKAPRFRTNNEIFPPGVVDAATRKNL